MATGTIHYYFSDHLGSASVVTNATGTTIEEESDYYPWGRERVIVDLLPDQNYKFTGKERDLESGLDYFGARYYSSGLGRWLSPDWSRRPTPIPYVILTDPRTLNLYSYVRNNPMKYTDADGHADSTVVDEEVFNDGDSVTFYQKKTEKRDIKDEQGNVVGQQTFVTVTYVTFSIGGDGPPTFLNGTQTWSSTTQDVNGNTISKENGQVSTIQNESTALGALGGASHVYDKIASEIRTDGNIRFVGTVAAGAAGAPGTAAKMVVASAAARGAQWAKAAKEGGLLLIDIVKETVFHRIIWGNQERMENENKDQKPKD